MIFHQLKLNGRAYTQPDAIFAQNFGKKCRHILDNEIIDMSTTRYSKRPDKLIFTLNPNFELVPKNGKRGLNYHFKRLKIL